MRALLVSLIVGLMFGFGLTLSGMTLPHRVIGFLDVFGQWDPTLAFVMLGAIGVHFVAYRFVAYLRIPFFGPGFVLPTQKNLDFSLIAGAGLFGIGWALGGFCPGPALTSLVSLQIEPLIFVGCMALGMLLQGALKKRF
jgi:uncharacterized protein